MEQRSLFAHARARARLASSRRLNAKESAPCRPFLDGGSVKEVTDNQFLDSISAGLWICSSAQVNIRNFKVIAL